MLLSEEELGLNLCPDDVPVLQLPAWNTAGPIQRLLLPDTAAVAQYSFDLDQQSGRAALDAEPFSAAGCALSCWLKAIDPTPHIDLMAQAMDRFTLANPFSSLCLALDLAPGMPLDALDALDRILDRRLLSHYIERLHHPLAPTPRPSRRLLAIQRLDLAPRIDADWLDDLRLVSEVVWRHTCRSPDEAVDAASRLPSESDYLLLSLPEAAGSQTLPLGQELFRALLSRAPAPHRIILSGIQLHWNWVRHQTASTGDEW
jgi:hypothetical protein